MGLVPSYTLINAYLLLTYADYQSTFTITDRSQWSNDSGLKVKFFRPTTAELPPVEAKGDIVILRNIKVSLIFLSFIDWLSNIGHVRCSYNILGNVGLGQVDKYLQRKDRCTVKHCHRVDAGSCKQDP